MSQTMVRLNPSSHAALKLLADETGESMTHLVERAIEDYRRKRLLDLANAQWQALLDDPATAAELAAEDAELDALVNEGLENEEPWPW